MDRIDFRSDTVSWPTPKMREAMAQAHVGDDVYGEDPTVNRLEAMAAEKVGKESSLFVSSGTMGNLIAILAHTTRGDEAIMGHDAHTIRAEAGGMATLGSVVPKPLPTDQFGKMDLDELNTAVSPDNEHYPNTSLILVENSYGMKQGYPIEPAYYEKIREIANRQRLKVHMDGARLFNSAVSQNIPASELTAHVDTVTFCLSKGLSAPAGSILCGDKAFIKKARRARKSLGGGMRQAGILAAAGMLSLTEMVERLDDDHRRATMLAEGLDTIPGIHVNPEMVKTNIVFFDLDESVHMNKEEIMQQLREKQNIWIGSQYGRRFRLVTHYWIRDEDVTNLLDSLKAIMTSNS
ncbi:MAG: low-specificity L-threonine aldolase [Chloroflexota bacterium]